MTARERILALRLLEKQERSPEYAKRIGIQVSMLEKDSKKLEDNCFYHGGVEFDYASLKGIGPHNYALFQAARGIYSDAKGITPADLADPEVVDDETFRLIINGLLIAKFGLCALKLKKGDNHNG